MTEAEVTAALDAAWNGGGRPSMIYWLDEWGDWRLFETTDDGKTWHEVKDE